MPNFAVRLLASLAGVAIVTVVGARLLPGVNATTIGFAYLLLVLAVASTWGFIEAAIASIAATLSFNFFFFQPVGTLTIADPANWAALFSFLATSLIASRLSAKAERRAQEAVARRQDVEHLYTFSRSILLIEGGEPFPKHLAQALAEAFALEAVALYDRRTDQVSRGGPSDFEGLDDHLRQASLHGASILDPQKRRVITAVRLGSEPIGALGLQGAPMQDSVVQGIANLVAIGLERAKAQDLAHQVEAARRSEQLRTTLLDAMAHEFKTPLTSIKAATTALLADTDQPLDARMELLSIADEEADHLSILIDDAIEMARLDSDHIDLESEPVAVDNLVRETVQALRSALEDRTVNVGCDAGLLIYADGRLIRLAVKQILDNALKYSRPGTPIDIRVSASDGLASIAITDHGEGIPVHDQARIFERFYRGPLTKEQMPGSGLGLSIAKSITNAHHGALTVTSRPGETTFRLALPMDGTGGRK